MTEQRQHLSIGDRLRRLPPVWRNVGLGVMGGLLCEIGSRVVAPNIDGKAPAEFLRRVGAPPLLRVYDWIVGGALSRGAVLALGVMPYVSAHIVMRLGRMSIPRIAALYDNDSDRPRLRRWRYALTFGLSVVQSFGFARFVQSIPGVVANPGPSFFAQTMMVLTAGAMGIAWIGERLATPDAVAETEPRTLESSPTPPRVLGVGEDPVTTVGRREREPIVVRD
jgi:preprotein translocase subunit SecY